MGGAGGCGAEGASGGMLPGAARPGSAAFYRDVGPLESCAGAGAERRVGRGRGVGWTDGLDLGRPWAVLGGAVRLT